MWAKRACACAHQQAIGCPFDRLCCNSSLKQRKSLICLLHHKYSCTQLLCAHINSVCSSFGVRNSISYLRCYTSWIQLYLEFVCVLCAVCAHCAHYSYWLWYVCILLLLSAIGLLVGRMHFFVHESNQMIVAHSSVNLIDSIVFFCS